MLKKLLLTTCLTLGLSAFASTSWAQEDDDDEFVSAPAASADDGDDEFVSAPAAKKSQASVSDDEDDEEEAADDSNMNISASQRKELAARKKFEEEQRLDEYANSLRRRDWLRNRLVLQVGMGSRYAFMGETGMGMSYGIGAEYILPFHLALYGSFGLLPKGTDNDFDDWKLEGGTGWKAGINYYLFPKNPLHLGLSVSYGTVYFDHDIIPEDGVRPIISVNGVQGDILITYLTNEWYYLQFSIGMYYAPELAKDKRDNISFRPEANSEYNKESETQYISRVVNKKGMNKQGIVFGIAIGYAFPEFFPDDTEKRRRQREKERARGGR